MPYLKHSEITENSIIVIDYENGKSEPYFVAFKRTGGITRGTMLLGQTLDNIVLRPQLFPFKHPGGDVARFYAASDEHPDGGHKGVIGYRNLNQQEKEEWVSKLQGVNLLQLSEIISKA